MDTTPGSRGQPSVAVTHGYAHLPTGAETAENAGLTVGTATCRRMTRTASPGRRPVVVFSVGLDATGLGTALFCAAIRGDVDRSALDADTDEDRATPDTDNRLLR